MKGISYKVLAINSLPAYGMAGLKCAIPILGEDIIPVPSLLLTGLGNMPGHRRFLYDFASNLEGTLHHLRELNEKVVLYVGYLANADQVPIICTAIKENPDTIEKVVVDPVCGDHGKAYVPTAIIEAWPELLALADWATPNSTEAQLLTTLEIGQFEKAITQLVDQFPSTNWLITSLPLGAIHVNRLIQKGLAKDFEFQFLPYRISGTGDAFTSFFIRYYFLELYSPEESLMRANDAVREQIVAQIPLKKN